MFSWFGKVSFVPYTKISDFAVHLKDGRLMASRCSKCGETSFPPRADCSACLAGEFEYKELSGKATLHTFTRIDAAPTGFEDEIPYTVGVADLEEGLSGNERKTATIALRSAMTAFKQAPQRQLVRREEQS